MKNKLCYILLGLLLNFSFITSVFAEGLEFSMTATADNTSVVVGEKAIVTVALKSDSVVSSCQFNVNIVGNIELMSKNGLNNWNFSSDVGEKNSIVNNSSDGVIYTEGKNIFNLEFKINESGKVTIGDIICTSSTNDENNEPVEVTGGYQNMEVSFTTKEVVDDTSLSGLTVTGGTLLTEFSPNVYEYMIDLNDPNFSLNITTSNELYQDKIVITDINGNVLDPQNITYSSDGGQNFMKMTVTINENTSQQYILIARYEQKNLSNSLASLKINGTKVNLSDDKVDYTIKVGKDVTEVNVEAELKDNDNFEFRLGNEPGIYQTPIGTTSIALMVVPKSSQIGAESKTYYIEIIRESATGSTTDNDGNTTTNPSTGNISMFLMAFILIASLIGSVFLYKKNIESYR